MQRPLIVGVMGGSRVDEQSLQDAYRLGALIARQGWVLLNGGRDAGVMEASARGASEAGGLTIGILPDADRKQAGPSVRIPICTGMGSARNVINILSSDIVVACKGGPGTLSEIALAVKHGKHVITLGFEIEQMAAWIHRKDQVHRSRTPEEAIRLILMHFPGDQSTGPVAGSHPR